MVVNFFTICASENILPLKSMLIVMIKVLFVYVNTLIKYKNICNYFLHLIAYPVVFKLIF